ncbi:MAG: glycoside hydrolase family 2 protein [Pseudomonadales bacterium]
MMNSDITSNSNLSAAQTLPRPEYPRPNFVREKWLNLNGPWSFRADPENLGLNQHWFDGFSSDDLITVPFAPGSQASGVQTVDHCNTVWYCRALPPLDWNSDAILLNIGAADHATTVWINGQHLLDHRGGYSPIQGDIKPFLTEANNFIVFRISDTTSWQQPRGKQAGDTKWPIDYDGIIGIWQTVWLEPASSLRIESVGYRYHAAEQRLQISVGLSGHSEAEIKVTLHQSEAQSIKASKNCALRSEVVINLEVPHPRLWCPDDPYLYPITLQIYQDQVPGDQVLSYTGLRTIDIDRGALQLNGEKLYVRGILDQGYFEQGWYTAVSDEALKRDVELTLAMGFNLVRKHQKIEDPRYLFWADQLGLLVWNEMPSGRIFSKSLIQDLTLEWMAIIERDQAHPSIVGWVPFNESWGIWNQRQRPEQRHFVDAIFHLTKALDPSRPVVGNDGWEYSMGDLWTLHLYDTTQKTLESRLQALIEVPSGPVHDGAEPRAGALPGADPTGKPILLTECGGIGLLTAEALMDDAPFAYGDLPKTVAELTHRTEALLAAINATRAIEGFVWTQFTDVQQEINGLLTFNREPKIPLETLRSMILKVGQQKVDLA